MKQKEKLREEIIDNLVDDIIYDLSNELIDDITERDVINSAEKNISKYDLSEFDKKDEQEIIDDAVEYYINL